jgi:uncharacterized protein
MKNALYLLMILPILFLSWINPEENFPQGSKKKEERILVFSKTTGFRHNSIPEGKMALLKLGEENKFKVDTTENSAVFTTENLKKYKAVVFLNTTGDILDHDQKKAFQNYIKGGGGFVGIHSATDTEYNWPWYNKLVGAYFLSHPENQVADIEILDFNHLSTKFFKGKLENNRWRRLDEWYNFKSINTDVKVLANLDEKSYKGGKNGDNHPIAWYHEYDGGRAFYTALGHTKESYTEELFLKHILGGVKYAMGKN